MDARPAGLTVDWDVARRVAARIGRNDEPIIDAEFPAELARLTAHAEELVEAETGLRSLAGPARSRVTSRSGWVEANLASFDRLLRPLLGRLDEDVPTPTVGPAGVDDAMGASADDVAAGRPWTRVGDWLGQVTQPVADAVGPRSAGAQLGAVLGWMSTRVIGQYDLLIVEDERPEDQDWVYYVGPNVTSLEERYGFEPSEFRLWIAIHECTHRAQFTGVAWLRPFFLSLVNELIDTVDPDPGRILDAMRELVERRRNGDSSLDGGLSTLLATPEQRLVLDRVSGLMSLLEGHGDIVMDRAGAGLIPSQPRFARIMSQRRQHASGPSRLLQKALGFDAKLAQYAEGERFIHAVEAAGGRELFDQVWEGPENLPTIEEVRDPDLWIRRINSSSAP